MKPSPFALFAVALALLLAAFVSAAVHGTVGGEGLAIAGPGTIWQWLTGDALEGRIFWELRLPRIAGAALVGAGLAASGCAFQATLGNPLAEPYTLGVSSGAALAAVVAIRLGLAEGTMGLSGVGFAALAGALLTVYIVWRLATLRRTPHNTTLLLAGITVAMFCGSATMVVQYTANIGEVYRMVRWMMGGLDGVIWDSLPWATILTAMGIGPLLWLARDFNALAAGHEAAAALGTRVPRVVATSFACCALLVGGGIAIAGPIGFVGLIVPHMLRPLIGSDHRKLLPASALGGAALLVMCDLGARVVLYPAELPVGVITALLGGPFFLMLLLRDRAR